MNDLRKAAEMALEALEYYRSFEDCQPTPASKTIPALRQALDDEPLVKSYCGGVPNYCTPEVTGEVTGDVDETAKGEHEPVCFIRETSWSYEIASWNDPNGFPVYTAPLKKEWVGLTKKEFEQAVDGLEDLEDCWVQIEAKLREKNT